MSEDLLDLAAQVLDRLSDDMVYVGGAAIHLWITDPAAPATRATNDVDVISAVSSRTAYYTLSEQLRDRGFREATDSEVICRWYHRDTGLVLDVMPQDPDILGFSNEWYEYAIATAVPRELSSGAQLRAASPVAVVATKLAAWKGRGKRDLLRSLDVHDVVVLADGREALPDELAHAPAELRSYVSHELEAIVRHSDFSYLLESALQSYGEITLRRVELVRSRITMLLGQG